MAAANRGPTGFRLPILQGVLPLRADQIPAEIVAGVTLAAIAIPQVLGYAKIANLPVITGLYTLLIPTALFAVFGSSRHLVVGADSATAAILGAGLVGLASIGSEAHVALAAVLALMAGGFVLLARVLGLAFMADFLSRTVLIGFLTGVGFQVALGQLSGMLGLQGVQLATMEPIGASLSGAFVVNSSPTRAQIVDSAGGRTQLPMLVTTLIVLAVLLFLTAPLAYMPEAVLSAVVFLVGIGLIDLRGLRSVYQQRRSEFWIALITTLMVVMIGVEQGILLAIVLSLVDHTRRGYHPKNAVVVRGATGAWQSQPVATGAQVLPGLIIYRFNHSMYYANAQQLTEEIATLVKRADPPLRWLCIDAAAVDDVDYTAAEAIRSIFGLLKEKGIRLVVAEVMSKVAEESRYDLRRLFGEDAFYETLGDVVTDYQHSSGQTQPATKGVR